jgi:hypothetical protein
MDDDFDFGLYDDMETKETISTPIATVQVNKEPEVEIPTEQPVVEEEHNDRPELWYRLIYWQ